MGVRYIKSYEKRVKCAIRATFDDKRLIEKRGSVKWNVESD